MLTTLTVGLMVSYILDSLNFKPAAFFDGFDDFWGFDGFDDLFDQRVKGEFDDRAWWSGFWLVADDGALSAVAMLDDGGLIVDRNLIYQICF